MKGVELTKILNDLVVRFQAAEKSLSEQASVVPQYDLRARQSAPDFYLHVTSGAILEDCREARFRPLQMDYKEMHADYHSSGLDRSTNYDKVSKISLSMRRLPPLKHFCSLL